MMVVRLRQEMLVWNLRVWWRMYCFFVESPRLTELVNRMKERLGWKVVKLEGVIDVGLTKGPHIKRMLKITSQSE